MTERASIRYVPGTALSAAVTALAAHQPRWTLTDGGRSIVSSNFARFFQAHMPARAARAAEIIAAAKLVTRDAAAGAGTYDVDPDEEARSLTTPSIARSRSSPASISSPTSSSPSSW